MPVELVITLACWTWDVEHLGVSRGMMGGCTPNIDRIANEGMIFIDHYTEASCTAGRRRSSPVSTDPVGLATVGLPGPDIGLLPVDELMNRPTPPAREESTMAIAEIKPAQHFRA